jgi:hypothetical protein
VRREIRESAVRKQEPLSFFAIAGLPDAALAQCRSVIIRKTRPMPDRLTRGFGAWGDWPAASALVENIDAQAVAQLAGVPDVGGAPGSGAGGDRLQARRV